LLFITVSLDWGSKQVISAREIISRIEKELNSEPNEFQLKIKNYIEDYNSSPATNWGVDLAITSVTINCALFITWILNPENFYLPQEFYPSYVANISSTSASGLSGCSESLINGMIYWGLSFFIFITLLMISILLRTYCAQRIAPKNLSRFSQWLINGRLHGFLNESKLLLFEQYFLNFLTYSIGSSSLILVLYSLYYGGFLLTSDFSPSFINSL
jgi:hypothetical protein